MIVAVLIAVHLSFPRTPFTGQTGNDSPPAAVGALFTTNGSNPVSHFCSASVVHSPKGNLLITAAHCMLGLTLQAPNRVAFAPGYHDGKFPLGLWAVTAIFVTPRWTAQQDPNDDIAFLTVASNGRTVEQAAGADLLSPFTPVTSLPAEVIGYPDNSEQPVICSAPAVPYQVNGLRQLEFSCDGYTTGTSGGPFLVNVDPATGDGEIIGVIGGYQQGGYSSAITYSTEFLDNVAALYEQAITAD